MLTALISWPYELNVINMNQFAHNRDYGLLIMRVIIGAVFFVHGYQHLFSARAGSLMFFSHIGFGAFWLYLVGAVELLGGLSLIFGYASKVFAGLLAIVALVAAIKTGTGHGFAGYEYLFVLFGVSFGLALIGPGKYSLGASCGCPVKKGACAACNEKGAGEAHK